MSAPGANLLLGIETMIEISHAQDECLTKLLELCSANVEDLPPEFSLAAYRLIEGLNAKREQLVADARRSL